MTPYELYVAYAQAKATSSGKKLVLATEAKFLDRLSVVNREILIKTTGYFNTVFSNVNPYSYMLCGFSLWKTFGYSKFLNENIITEYITYDKRQKRDLGSTHESINRSMEYINKPLREYCREGVDDKKRIISDYLLNKIDASIVVYCLFKKYVKFDEFDKGYITIIYNNYDRLLNTVIQMESEIEKIDRRITGQAKKR